MARADPPTVLVAPASEAVGPCPTAPSLRSTVTAAQHSGQRRHREHVTKSSSAGHGPSDASMWDDLRRAQKDIMGVFDDAISSYTHGHETHGGNHEFCGGSGVGFAGGLARATGKCDGGRLRTKPWSRHRAGQSHRVRGQVLGWPHQRLGFRGGRRRLLRETIARTTVREAFAMAASP